jgi:hypothetical protein
MCEQDWNGSGQNQMLDICEYSNEPLDNIKAEHF